MICHWHFESIQLKCKKGTCITCYRIWLNLNIFFLSYESPNIFSIYSEKKNVLMQPFKAQMVNEQTKFFLNIRKCDIGVFINNFVFNLSLAWLFFLGSKHRSHHSIQTKFKIIPLFISVWNAIGSDFQFGRKKISKNEIEHRNKRF